MGNDEVIWYFNMSYRSRRMSNISGPITNPKALDAMRRSTMDGTLSSSANSLSTSLGKSPVGSLMELHNRTESNASSNPLTGSGRSIGSDEQEMDLLEALMMYVPKASSSAPEVRKKHPLSISSTVEKKGSEKMKRHHANEEEVLPSPFGTIGPLDQELRKILNHLECTIDFTKWCQSHFCEENILFWVDVEILRSVPAAAFHAQVEQMYSTYFVSDKESIINVDSDSMDKLVAAHKAQKLTTSSFDDMQAQVFRLMENDCVRKYLESHNYKTWREEYAIRKKKETEKHSFFSRRHFLNKSVERNKLPARYPSCDSTANIERLFALRAVS